MFDFLKKKKIKKNDELTFYYDYVVHGNYSNTNKNKILTLPDIFSKFKKINVVPKEWNIFVKSEFNGITYPMFDLDTIEHKETFEKLYNDVSYVLFQSSQDHYWGILGIENKNMFTDTFWLSCNDVKFVSMTKMRGEYRLRCLYNNLNIKPINFNVNGQISDNFKKFLDKLKKIYSNEALELSIIKYKDPQMMLKFDRKRKLDKINGIV